MELQQRILNRVAEHFKVDRDSLNLETTLSSLGADSLDMVELSMELEDEFGFMMEQSDITAIKTLGDVVRFVESKKI